MSGAHQIDHPADISGGNLRECPDCGLFQSVPRLRPGLVAECPRCGAVLRRRRRNSFVITMVLMLTGIALFTVLLYAPLLSMRFYGRQQGTTLPELPLAFEPFGMWELSLVVLTFTMIAPLLKLVLTAGVLIGLRRRVSVAALAAMGRVRAWLTPWAMTEVFLLGMFVAYTRLSVYATVQFGAALYAMAGLMLVMVAADAWFDEHAMWEAVGWRRGWPHRPATQERQRVRLRGELIGCDTCGQVTRAHEGDPCPRCESWLRRRKPESLARSWALLIAAAALYIPSNILPIMTYVQLGRSQTTTILGGVQELIAFRMWPLAVLVFVASIAVPIVKLVLLGYLLATTQLRRAEGLRRRASVYRLIDVIGRWSMIDVFMISILTALVRMGQIASVIPGNGAICFAGVVILTMLAAFSFDPRLMWDAAEHAEARQPAPAEARA